MGDMDMEQNNTHKKGSIPPQNQAFQIDISNTTPDHNIKPPCKEEQVYMMILSSGSTGITGLDIQRHCHVISGRNFPSLLKRQAGVLFRWEWEANSEDDGRHKRHWLIDRNDARKVLREINGKRYARGASPIQSDEAERLLSLYPVAPEQAA